MISMATEGSQVMSSFFIGVEVSWRSLGVGWLLERFGLHVEDSPNREDSKQNTGRSSSLDDAGSTIPVSMWTSGIYDYAPPSSCRGDGFSASLSCILPRRR